MAAHDVLQRGRREEILLPQAELVDGLGYSELAASRRGIAGIEHARDRLRVRARGDRADEVALVERRKLNRVSRARRPQSQRIDVAPAPAHDRRVIGHCVHRLRRIPNAPRSIAVTAEIFDHSAEPDGIGELAARQFPGIAVGEPIVGQLALPAIGELLAKQAMFVTDAVTMGRHAETTRAVQVTGREPAEPAGSEPRIRLQRAQVFEIDLEAGQRLAYRLDQPEVRQRVE